MLARMDILERFKLQDRSAFEIEPYRDECGVWRIKVGHEGDPTSLMSQGAANRLANEIRSVDHDLAVQLEDCLERARRYSKKPN